MGVTFLKHNKLCTNTFQLHLPIELTHFCLFTWEAQTQFQSNSCLPMPPMARKRLKSGARNSSWATELAQNQWATSCLQAHHEQEGALRVLTRNRTEASHWSHRDLNQGASTHPFHQLKPGVVNLSSPHFSNRACPGSNSAEKDNKNTTVYVGKCLLGYCKLTGSNTVYSVKMNFKIQFMFSSQRN